MVCCRTPSYVITRWSKRLGLGCVDERVVRMIILKADPIAAPLALGGGITLSVDQAALANTSSFGTRVDDRRQSSNGKVEKLNRDQ